MTHISSTGKDIWFVFLDITPLMNVFLFHVITGRHSFFKKNQLTYLEIFSATMLILSLKQVSEESPRLTLSPQ